MKKSFKITIEVGIDVNFDGGYNYTGEEKELRYKNKNGKTDKVLPFIVEDSFQGYLALILAIRAYGINYVDDFLKTKKLKPFQPNFDELTSSRFTNDYSLTIRLYPTFEEVAA